MNPSNPSNATRFLSFVFSLVGAALLAACATRDETSPPAAPALSPAPAPPLATGNLAVDGLRWLNYRRARMGLSALTQNAALGQISASHPAYLAANQSCQSHGHRQIPGLPGFSGADPFVRMANVGFAANPRSENMTLSRFNEGADKIDALIDAPYHRLTQLGAFAQAGAGSSFVAGANPQLDGYYFVANFAGSVTRWGLSANQVVVVPAPGQPQAPTSWRVLETPNPLPDFTGQVVGYPLSILAEPDSKLVVTAFTLTDDRSAYVNGRLIATWVDLGQSLGNYAVWIPLAPLAAGTRYTAHASGGLDGALMDLRWSFTTAPFKALAITGRQPARCLLRLARRWRCRSAGEQDWRPA